MEEEESRRAGDAAAMFPDPTEEESSDYESVASRIKHLKDRASFNRREVDGNHASPAGKTAKLIKQHGLKITAAGNTIPADSAEVTVSSSSSSSSINGSEKDLGSSSSEEEEVAKGVSPSNSKDGQDKTSSDRSPKKGVSKTMAMAKAKAKAKDASYSSEEDEEEVVTKAKVRMSADEIAKDHSYSYYTDDDDDDDDDDAAKTKTKTKPKNKPKNKKDHSYSYYTDDDDDDDDDDDEEGKGKARIGAKARVGSGARRKVRRTLTMTPKKKKKKKHRGGGGGGAAKAAMPSEGNYRCSGSAHNITSAEAMHASFVDEFYRSQPDPASRLRVRIPPGDLVDAWPARLCAPASVRGVYAQEDVDAVLRSVHIMVALACQEEEEEEGASGSAQGTFRLIIVTQDSEGCSARSPCTARYGAPIHDADQHAITMVGVVSSSTSGVLVACVACGPTVEECEAKIVANKAGRLRPRTGSRVQDLYTVTIFDPSRLKGPSKFNESTIEATRQITATAYGHATPWDHAAEGGAGRDPRPQSERRIISVIVQTRADRDIAHMPIVRRAVALCPHLAHVAGVMFEARSDGQLTQPATLRLPETPQVQERKALDFSRHADMFFDACANNVHDSARPL
jgi:hypothetical protein